MFSKATQQSLVALLILVVLTIVVLLLVEVPHLTP